MLTTETVPTQAIVATPSDTVDIALPNDRSTMRGFQVNVAGNVVVDMQGSGTTLTLAVLAGVFYPYGLKRIRATGTTATGITVFF